MTSLSLLLEAKRFQCLGLRFGLSKELLRGRSLCPGVGPQGGVSRTREKRRWFYLWSTLPVLRWLHPAALPAVPAWPGAGSPKRALAGRCFEHRGGGGRLPPAGSPAPQLVPWQLPEKSGWAAWLCLPRLGYPQRDWPHSCVPFPRWGGWDGYTTRCSLVGQQQAGPLGPGCVLAGSWRTLAAVKPKSFLLCAETTEGGGVSMLT